MMNKLKPTQQKKEKPKEAIKKEGMSNILEQLVIYKQNLDSGGNIVRRNNAVDDDSEEESDDSFD